MLRFRYQLDVIKIILNIMDRIFNTTKINLNKNYFVQKLSRQLTIFILVGALCFLVDLILLSLLIQNANLSVLLSTCFSGILVTGLNYVLSIKFVFINGKSSIKQEIFSFYILVSVIFVINVVLMTFLTDKLGVWYIYSKFITALVVTAISFTVKKKIIFIK